MMGHRADIPPRIPDSEESMIPVTVTVTLTTNQRDAMLSLVNQRINALSRNLGVLRADDGNDAMIDVAERDIEFWATVRERLTEAQP
jgi:hypothetical protein